MRAVSQRRKPSALKLALGYFVALTCLASTVALPIVVVLANRELDQRKALLLEKERDLRQLKSERIQATGNAAESPEPDNQVASSDHTAGGGPASRVTVMKVHPGDADSQATAAPDAAAKAPRAHESLPRKGDPSPDQGYSRDFMRRLSRLHSEVVGPAGKAREDRRDDSGSISR